MEYVGMPVDTKKAGLKTLLLAPVPVIQAWAVQELASGDPVPGAIAMVIGIVMVGLYVVVQEYDIPYKDTILDLSGTVGEHVPPGEVADAVTDVAEETSEAADNATE